MELPQWHETSYDPREVVNLRTIAEMRSAPEYDALRSYATGRREHAVYGPMPRPVARIANRRLWLLADVEEWLTIPIPRWQRSRNTMQAWIAAGRPRKLAEGGEVAATLSGDHGRSSPAP